MRLVRAGFEFGVELNAHIEIVFGNFHRFHNVVIGRGSAYNKTLCGHIVAVIVVEFVAVAVTLLNFLRLIAFRHFGACRYFAGVRAEPHCSALVHLIALVGHEVYYLVV